LEDQRPDAPAFVRVARALIDDCYGDGRRTSLESLAAAAGVSPFHLVREFTRATGMSPHRYLVQTRVRRAGELLAKGAPVSDVAATVGFADQSHLTTQFRRYVGTTPALYRRGLAAR
jgi:AraC-like DNA-binding protein